ncbi:MAG: hypothetical protein ABI353_02230 [Isosphaeraceae bacterium]
MTRLRATFRPWLLAAVSLVAVTAAFAVARPSDEPKDQAERPHQEYLSQEVQAEAIVQTLNSLDQEGWDLFQVVPLWNIGADVGGTKLEAKTYQVFGRRPVKGGK